NNYRKNYHSKYLQYFSSEIKPFISEAWFKDNTNIDDDLIQEINEKKSENFYTQRKKGENNSFICKLVRKDLIDEFINYASSNNIQLNQTISLSIYETISFLIKTKQTSLINYAAFFGSIQIFKFLIQNGVKLTSSTWLYDIHGNNMGIISILENNHIRPEDETYHKCLLESIKCYHNEIVLHIRRNYFNDEELSNDVLRYCSKHYNYSFVSQQYISNTNDLSNHILYNHIDTNCNNDSNKNSMNKNRKLLKKPLAINPIYNSFLSKLTSNNNLSKKSIITNNDLTSSINLPNSNIVNANSMNNNNNSFNTNKSIITNNDLTSSINLPNSNIVNANSMNNNNNSFNTNKSIITNNDLTSSINLPNSNIVNANSMNNNNNSFNTNKSIITNNDLTSSTNMINNNSSNQNTFFTYDNLRKLKFYDGNAFFNFLQNKANIEGFKISTNYAKDDRFFIVNCWKHSKSNMNPCKFHINIQ
ncbi:hypothetical protein M9Y10_003356, partial [Tritrichomonas musculus]